MSQIRADSTATVPVWWTVHWWWFSAADPVDYKKSEERWGNRADDNTSPPNLPCDNYFNPLQVLDKPLSMVSRTVYKVAQDRLTDCPLYVLGWNVRPYTSLW